MRLILVFVAVISAGTSALTRGHSHHRPPVRNQLRRSGPFHHHYHGHIQSRGHNTQHHRPSPSPSPRFQRSQFSHHNAYITPYPTQTLHQLGGAGGVNYGYVAGGSNNDHGQSFGGGQILNSLTQAFSPVQPPILSVSPIIPYEPESELPGSHHHEHHGPVHHGPTTKQIFVFSAPPDPSDNVRPHIVKTFPQQKQKHYQVLFINAPPPALPPQHTVELPQPPELKTQIYVLVKKPQPAPPVKIIPSKVPVNKPEVYFIRYKNNQDASDGYAPVPSDVPIIYPQPVPHDDVLNHHNQPPQPDDLVYQNIQHQHEEFLHPQPQPGGEYVETTPPQEYIPVLTDNLHQNPNHLEYINAPQEHHQHPHHPQQLIEHYGGQAPADPYSDYSRLSAHYTTVTGRPISLLSPSPSSSKNKVKKLRIKHKSQISRIDDDNWTPLISNRSNDNNKKKQELDAGMSGI